MQNLGALMLKSGIPGATAHGTSLRDEPVSGLSREHRVVAEGILPLPLVNRLRSSKQELSSNVRDVLREISKYNCSEMPTDAFTGQIVFGILELAEAIKEEMPPSQVTRFFMGEVQTLIKANAFCETHPKLSGEELALELLWELFGFRW